ncbi:MAG TPA: FAD-dependent oxidoreductase [Solirubrobacteraceae bacterium]|nr:FAD-dependent oxidoreductase [Solirubrobacteraceae bacterium]
MTYEREFEAGAAVLAVPINALAAIDVTPPAHPLIAAAARRGQPCRSLKVHALTQGVPAGVLAAGWGAPLQWISAVGELDGAQLLVGFGYDRDCLDPDSTDSVEEALRAFAPGARVLAVDGHDWNADEFSAGGWGMWRPGWATDGTLTALNGLHGRLAYASSDFAPSWPGWMAGALSSGERAATLVRDRLRSQRL